MPKQAIWLSSVLGWLALRVLPWRWIQNGLMGKPAGTLAETEIQKLEELDRQIRRTVSGHRRLDNCLVNCLSLWILAGRKRTGLVMRIGVQPGAAGFSAHAWMEGNGRIIAGNHAEPFVALIQD